MKVSIIIVNYRSEQYLDKCLASVYRASDPRQREIIVVNNDREADLCWLVKKYSEAKFFNCEKNSGFGAGCNFGAKKAGGDILFFLNPDTQFLNDYVNFVINKFAESEKNVGIIGPRLVTDERKTQEWCAGKESTFWRLIKNNFGIVDSKKVWESEKEIFADWVSGAALAIKKEIFEKINGFNEDFFMYFEDEDLCMRARNLGYAVVYCPKTFILHSGGKSRESLLKQKIQHARSTVYYLMKSQNY